MPTVGPLRTPDSEALIGLYELLSAADGGRVVLPGPPEQTVDQGLRIGQEARAGGDRAATLQRQAAGRRVRVAAVNAPVFSPAKRLP